MAQCETLGLITSSERAYRSPSPVSLTNSRYCCCCWFSIHLLSCVEPNYECVRTDDVFSLSLSLSAALILGYKLFNASLDLGRGMRARSGDTDTKSRGERENGRRR